MKRVASILSMICLGWATLALPTQAAMGAVPPGIAEESLDLRTILDALVGPAVIMPGVRVQVDAAVGDLMTRDSKVDHALKTNPALKAALIDRATARYQSMVQDRLPALQTPLGRLFNNAMTAAQLKATARMMSSPTGKRVFGVMFTQLFSTNAEESEMKELSDAEVTAMINENDIPVFLAFSQTGADKKFEKVMDSIDSIEDQDFDPLLDDVDDFLLDILNEMQSGVKFSV